MAIFGKARQTAARRPSSAGLFSAMRPVLAGVDVNAESALTYSAVWACVRVISEGVAALPWQVYEKKAGVRERAINHQVYDLLDVSPNGECSSFDFRMSLMPSALLQGNGYAEIERNRYGEPVAFWQLDQALVNPDRDKSGKLYYDVWDGTKNVALPAADVLHIKGLGYDGLKGYSVIGMAKQSIGLGLATERFGAAFFGNGAIPGGVIELDNTVDIGDAGKALLKETFKTHHKGPQGFGDLQVLDPGMKYKQVSIRPDEAQFLESRKFGVLEICRWFGVKPHKVAELERSTNNNIEQQNLEHLTDTLMPWIVRFEQELNLKLFRGTPYYSKLNFSGRLRGDIKTRQEFYRTMLDRGVYCIDDVLALEDLNPLPGGLGQLRMVQANMVSLEQAKAAGNTIINNGGSKKND